MRPWTGWTGVCLLAGWLGLGAGQASAAWNNVFQVTCHGCRQQSSSFFAPAPAPVVAYSAPACPQPCPQPQVSYVQRSYYQPVVSYKMETRYEPVTSYRTSYYYEPVTSYRYTSYYDPCTGCCQQVCTPTTSYRMRSQCNAVQSYVQRCAMVPVTSYKQSCYYEPVVTYAPPACDPCPTCPPGGGAPAAGITEGQVYGQTQPPPQLPGAGIQETPGQGGLLPRQNIPGASFTRPAPAPVRNDRLAAQSRVAGTVVYQDRFTPRAGAKVVFVSSGDMARRQESVADPLGRFRVDLPAGDWWIYVTGTDGRAAYHSAVRTRPADDRLVTVVTR